MVPVVVAEESVLGSEGVTPLSGNVSEEEEGNLFGAVRQEWANC